MAKATSQAKSTRGARRKRGGTKARRATRPRAGRAKRATRGSRAKRVLSRGGRTISRLRKRIGVKQPKRRKLPKQATRQPRAKAPRRGRKPRQP